MILRPLSRPQTFLQAIVRPTLSTSRPALVQQQFRETHKVPLIENYDEHFRKNGIDGFLTKRAFRMVWTDYQAFLIEVMNRMVFGTPLENVQPLDLVEKYARVSSEAVLFNHASMAHNNHFFVNRLSPSRTQPSKSFMKDIVNSFDSIENLRAEMIDAADAMFGQGFVWLMKEEATGMLRILCTYNAGSPLSRAHYRSQSMVAATTEPFAMLAGRNPNLAEANRLGTVSNTVGNFGQHSQPSDKKQSVPGALDAGPILCVNAWQHCYLMDYGIDGKRDYLQKWWDRINWSMVEQSANHYGGENMRYNYGSRIRTAMGRTMRY